MILNYICRVCMSIFKGGPNVSIRIGIFDNFDVMAGPHEKNCSFYNKRDTQMFPFGYAVWTEGLHKAGKTNVHVCDYHWQDSLIITLYSLHWNSKFLSTNKAVNLYKWHDFSDGRMSFYGVWIWQNLQESK